MNTRHGIPFAVGFAFAVLSGCGSDDRTDTVGAAEETAAAELAAGGCGHLGKPCCAGSKCKGTLTCNYDHCSAGCGDLGQECCLPEQRCMPGYACNTSTMQCESPCGGA